MEGSGPATLTRSFGNRGLALGLGLLASAAFLAFVAAGAEQPWPLATVAALTGATGLVLTGWRWGLRIEDAGATIAAWQGLFLPMAASRQPRAAVTGVRLEKEALVAVAYPATFRYVVRVLCTSTPGDFQRMRMLDPSLARREAEAFAKFLRVDLRDESGAEPVVREAARLDESLVGRHRRLGLASPPLLSSPLAGASHARSESDGTVVIEIPPAGLRASLMAPAPAVAATAGAFLLLGWYVEARGDLPETLRIALAVCSLLAAPPVFMLIANLLALVTRRETIASSGAGITIIRRSLFEDEQHFVPAAQIEEITAPADRPGPPPGDYASAELLGGPQPGTQVLVRTDRRDVPAGESLPIGQRAWLRDALVHGLLGRGTGALAVPGASTDAADAADPNRDAGAIKRRALLAAGTVATLAAVAAIYHVGAPNDVQRAGVPDKATGLPGYQLRPGPGSGYLRMYAKGVSAFDDGGSLRLSVDEIALVSTSRIASTTYRDLSLSVHRASGQGWQLVGHAAAPVAGPAVPPGGTQRLQGPHVFRVLGAVDPCRRDPCSFRLHIVGQAGTGRPGWDVTDMSPLRLAP